MDILSVWTSDGREKAKLYRNIDPASIIVLNGKMCFAHPGAWNTNMVSNRYQIPIHDDSIFSTDPEWIKGYIESHEDVVNASVVSGTMGAIATLKRGDKIEVKIIDEAEGVAEVLSNDPDKKPLNLDGVDRRLLFISARE